MQTQKWSNSEFTVAMENAVTQNADTKYLKKIGSKLVFNGFWRGGDKQNVCAWLDRATWHDAKTGEGGGCKEFAEIAFSMSLPQFMDRFGQSSFVPTPKPVRLPIKAKRTDKSIDQIWQALLESRSACTKKAEDWLEKSRGFNASELIGSGFAELSEEGIAYFHPEQQGFLRQRLSLGPQLVVPLRGTRSGSVRNLFFRSLIDAEKNDKSRLLPGGGGWSDDDQAPRAFGFPHLIHDFSHLILCEGMADFFATECLLGSREDFLAIGAANAGALTSWAQWLSVSKFKGQVIILYQLDRDPKGKISSKAVGQAKAAEALKILLQNKISASLFRWPNFLRLLEENEQRPKDIAELCQSLGINSIGEHFLTTLKVSP